MAEEQRVTNKTKLIVNGKTTEVTLTGDHLVIGDNAVEIGSILASECPNNTELKISYATTVCPITLKLAEFNCQGSEGECQELHEKLKECIMRVPGRPKKLLTVVNPASGSGQGKQIAETQVQILFQLAGINFETITTTKDVSIAAEIESTDLKQYDGIVVIGGDGTIYDTTNAVVRKVQKEAGVDVDDFEAEAAAVDLPIGVIPTGMGNFLATELAGKGVESAALAIIMGKTVPRSLSSMFSDGKHVTFYTIGASYGFYSDAFFNAHHLHGMTSRMMLFFRHIFKYPRLFNAEVEFLPHDGGSDYKLGLETCEGERAGWVKIKDIALSGINTFIAENMPGSEVELDFDGDNFMMVLVTEAGRLDYLKMTKAIFTKQMSKPALPPVHKIAAKAMTVKLINVFPDDSSDTTLPTREECIGIQGETVRLPHPQFSVRVHKSIIQMFTNIS